MLAFPVFLIPILLLFLSAAALPFPARAGEPAAASAAFTSTDPVVIKALGLMRAGKFRQAEALLGPPPRAGAPTEARGELLDIIRRTRLEYSLAPAGLLAKIRKSIPDATPREVERWAKATRARSRVIDGQRFYFRREPQNIFLFSAEARERRGRAGNSPTRDTFKLTDHLRNIVEAAEKSGAVEVVPIRHRLTHTITIHSNSPALKSGAVVRVWLPYPQEYRQQRAVKLISASPEPKLVAPPGVDGNPVGGTPQRTAYFEKVITDPAQPLRFSETVEYTSYAYYPRLDDSLVQPLPPDWNGVCLGERPPHIVFAPEIRRQVSKIIGSETNLLAKARRIFHWVSANVPWNAEDEYCIIPSLALKGFTARRGDCGVQNTVFITMCRIAGVPARWQSGFETKPGDSWGMHDWAEIYIAPWGWLPADASYGVQPSSDPRIADFYLGHQDSYRMIVNLDWGRELVPPKLSLRSEPADFQRGEVEVDGRNLYFDEWDYNQELDRQPVSAME